MFFVEVLNVKNEYIKVNFVYNNLNKLYNYEKNYITIDVICYITFNIAEYSFC